MGFLAGLVGSTIICTILASIIEATIMRRLVKDVTLAVALSAIGAFVVAVAVGYFGYADGREPSLAYVPIVTDAIGAFIAGALVMRRASARPREDGLL